MKRALITGITGQDGSYLAELLLEKGYEVYGIMRRKRNPDYGNIQHILKDIHIIYGDVTDFSSLVVALQKSQPDEVYNLAALSYVGASWASPISTTEINALGVVNLLEAIRCSNIKCKIFQATTSEIFGNIKDSPQNENTNFYPRSPYGITKLFGHCVSRSYRDQFGMFICSGILYNHESERRGEEFVTRKITKAAAKISLGQQDCLYIGNLSPLRDWGHAKDYVEAMWLMLQQDKPDDYIISSGETHSVREFVELSFNAAGIELEWHGEGLNEYAVNKNNNKVVVKVDPQFYRPTESNILIGDHSKAEKVLHWKRKISYKDLVYRMVENDIKICERE